MNVGVIGTGFAEQHLEWIRACPDLTVTALAFNERQERARDLARRFSIPRVIPDASEVAASRDIDMVVIACPPYLHEEFATPAIEAGHVVVCDKPLAHAVEAAGRMAATADRLQVPTMTCFQWRDVEALRVLRAELADGTAGDLMALDLAFHHDFLAGTASAWPWRHDPGLAGGGALADLGVHLFDLLRWLTGTEWRVLDAQARVMWPVRTSTAPRPARDGATQAGGAPIAAGTEDIASVHLESADQAASARVHVSRVSHGYQALSATAVGTRATLRVEADPSSLKARFQRLGIRPDSRDLTSDANPYRRLAADLSSGRRTVPDFRDGLAAQDLMAQSVGLISR